MNDAQRQATEILSLYFGLQRTALSQYALAERGWTATHLAKLVGTLGTGMHNFPELASGSWDGQTSEEVVAAGLRRECKWLYDRAEALVYPGSWGCNINSWPLSVWKNFWDAVARPLDLPARYGVPCAIETDEQAFARIRMEAMRLGLIEYQRSLVIPPILARLLPSRRQLVLVSRD